MLRKTLMGIAVLALFATAAPAQTVDELLAKNFAAKGGLQKLKAVQSMKITGKLVMGQGIEAPFVMYAKRPKHMRMEFTIQGMTGVQAYDGKTAWMSMPFLGKKDPEQMPPEEAKMVEEQSDMDGPLVDYREKGNTVALAGKEQVEGAEAYKIKVTLKNGDVRWYYLDAETYLEIKGEAKRTIRGTEVDGESFISDYKEVDGLMMAHAMESGAKGVPQRQKMVFEKIEFNVPLADSLFAMPATAGADSSKAAAAGTAKADSAKAAEGAGQAAKGAAKAAIKAVEAVGKAAGKGAESASAAQADSAKASGKKQ